MKKNYSIFCTLGPATLNSHFLKFADKNKDLIALLRLNLSHLEKTHLEKSIKLIKKYTSIPICLDTEGAQIRTRLDGKKIFIKKNQIISIKNHKSKIGLYPDDVYQKLKVKDILDVGFENLKLKIIKKNNKNIILQCVSGGYLEKNKGVHVINRKLFLNTLTNKDFQCIETAKKLGVQNYALSFTNNISDIKKFKSILKGYNRIYKIETIEAIKNFKKFINLEKNFLIDRGDLSKEISIAKIPLAQRYLFNFTKRKKIQIAVATNLLESMILNPYPTRAEANDIYNSLEMGCSKLVLAGETAVGKYPKECINFLRELITTFKNSKFL